MISLKMPPEERSETMLGAEPEKARYGYGTCINLEEEQVKALGIGKLQAGTRVRIIAYGIVDCVRVDVNEDEDENEGKNMSIQLTDMEASAASAIADGAARKMYGG